MIDVESEQLKSEKVDFITRNRLTQLQRRTIADIVRSVAFCNAYLYIIMKAVNGLLMTQRQITLKDVWGYNVRKRHRPRMSDAFL